MENLPIIKCTLLNNEQVAYAPFCNPNFYKCSKHFCFFLCKDTHFKSTHAPRHGLYTCFYRMHSNIDLVLRSKTGKMSIQLTSLKSAGFEFEF